MTYNEAMKIVLDGGHVHRPRMIQYDIYIRLEGADIVVSTNEGYAVRNYEPTMEDKQASDWKEV